MSKQTVTFELSDVQMKKWGPILENKDGVKTLTGALRDLAVLKKYKEKQVSKKKMSCIQSPIPVEDNYKIQHWQKYKTQIAEICKISREVYYGFPFSGKEHHFQSALEEELRDAGYHVQQEVARLLHYTKRNGEIVQLPHDIRGREDLLLPREKLILELKQVSKLTGKEFGQICRYMQERSDHTTWGKDTRGMLINFGDYRLECWYLFYDKTNGRISRIQTAISDAIDIDTLFDTYYQRG